MQEKELTFLNVGFSPELTKMMKLVGKKYGMPMSQILRMSVLKYCREELENERVE